MTYTPRQSLSLKIAKQIFAAQHPFGVKRTQGEKNEDAHWVEQQTYHENIMKYIDEYVDEQKRLYAESVNRDLNETLDKYYVWQNEDGSYQYDPSDNQLIDELRSVLSGNVKKEEIRSNDLSDIPFY